MVVRGLVPFSSSAEIGFLVDRRGIPKCNRTNSSNFCRRGSSAMSKLLVKGGRGRVENVSRTVVLVQETGHDTFGAPRFSGPHVVDDRPRAVDVLDPRPGDLEEPQAPVFRFWPTAKWLSS